MLMALHMTRQSLWDQYGRKDELEEQVEDEESSGAMTEEEKEIADAKKKALAPYDAAYAMYLQVGRHLFGDLSRYDGVRQSVSLGIGGVLASNFLAPTARIGYDVRIGRRLVLTPVGYWIGESSKALTSDITVRTQPAAGGGMIISYGF